MTPDLNLLDFAAISPLIIILMGSLIVLLLESFAMPLSKKYSPYLTFIVILVAFCAIFKSPISESPLLTAWLRFDHLSRLFTAFFLLIGLCTTLLAASFLHRFNASSGEFYFLILSALFGLMLIGDAADFLTLFLGLETLSISLYILCGYIKKWRLSQEAALKYFLMGSVAAGFLLYGIALIYGAVGSTNFEALQTAYHSSSDNVLFLSGMAFVTLGLAFKAAIVPFHFWAPDVYCGASTPVTAFMAVGTKAGAFVALALMFIVILPNEGGKWHQALAWLAFPTLIYANFLALCQRQLRRFFAYSGISHAGFLLMPLAAGTADALPALLFYLVIYALATLGSFSVLAQLDEKGQGVFLDDLKGLFYRAPWLASLFTVCLLTLGGIPPFPGFLAKFFLFKVAFETNYYALVIVALLTSIIAAFYYLRIIAILFSETKIVSAIPNSRPAAAVGIFAVLMLVWLTFSPFPLLNF